MSRVHKGDTGLLGQMKWEIIWPRRDNPPNLRRGNNGSVVIAFRGDKLSMIFLGDLGKPAQQLIFSDFTNTTHGAYDIVKVAHHGSSDQFPMLYKHISAKYGIISAGKQNRYGHPTKIALEILRKYGTQPWLRLFQVIFPFLVTGIILRFIRSMTNIHGMWLLETSTDSVLGGISL